MKNHIKVMGWTNLLLIGAAAGGCGGDGGGTGSLTALLEAEDVIVDGIAAGEDPENIRDGWTVTFDRYIATVGDLDMYLSTDETVDVEGADVFVVDMTQVPSAGLDLWQFDDMRAGRWEFNYATPGAADGGMRHSSVSQADFDEMVTNDWTYLIDGTIANAAGESCPPAALAQVGSATPNGNMSGTNPCYDAPSIRFTFGATAETSFTLCEVDEVPGFAVTAGGATSVSMTLHGDHLFFNGFPEGDEGGVTRLAQWLADCDLDLDGLVTQEELEAITPAQLPEIDDRYQFGGTPIAITNMYTYVIAQLKTQGHFQGEGECEVDGVGHDHD